MKLRTTLAAAPAAALLALATCAEPPIPTAAGPADLGVDAPVLPSAGSGMRAIAEEWPLCRIATTETDQSGNPGPWVLGGRRGVAKGPPPRPDPFNGTSTVLEGMHDNQPQMIFWTADYCPTREDYGVELEIRLDSIWMSPWHSNWYHVWPMTLPPYLLWLSEERGSPVQWPAWFMTFNPALFMNLRVEGKVGG